MSESHLTMRAFRIRGRVQGVGFRWWTREEALALGLRGTVRNTPDGSVEVFVAGPRHAIDRLAERLVVGPPAAVVEGIEELPPSPAPPPDDFRIIR
jgi:acylphosphatase